MATPGRYLPVRIWQKIRALAKLGWRQTRIAEELDLDRNTVMKHWPEDVKRPPVGRPPTTCLGMM